MFHFTGRKELLGSHRNIFPVATKFECILNANADAPQVRTGNLFPCIEVDITFSFVLLSTSFPGLLGHSNSVSVDYGRITFFAL